jgi:hypothetical protein
LQLFDGRFSKSNSAVAERHMGGFGALCDCASHKTCRYCETVPHNGANEQTPKTRAIRGRHGMWLYLGERVTLADSVLRPLLSLESHARGRVGVVVPNV